MCCTRLAEKYRTQKIAISAPSHNFVGLYLRNWSMYRQLEKKNFLNSNTSSTCPHNIVNFDPLTAEICWRVWGTQQYDGFRVLAALLHGTVVVGVSQTLRRWTEGATYNRQGGHNNRNYNAYNAKRSKTTRKLYFSIFAMCKRVVDKMFPCMQIRRWMTC